MKNLDDYVPVHKRIELFRAEHPQGRILTQILEGESLTVRAEVYFDGSDVPNASAHASEDGGMAGRKSSAVEKTETAAVGRALAFCGYEVKEGIVSREEVKKATAMPPTKRTTPYSGSVMPPEFQSLTPDQQHKELADSIKTICEGLGYSEKALTKWISDRYETDGGLDSLPIGDKMEVLKVFLDKQAEAEAVQR